MPRMYLSLNMKTRLLIIGAGGHGKVCADIAYKMGKWDIIAFLDNDTSKKQVVGFSVIDTAENAKEYYQDSEFFVAIGDNEVRSKLFDELKGKSIATLIHPSAIIGLEVMIDCGTVLMANTVVNSGARIGKCCIINTATTVDHDCNVGDFVHLSPGVSVAGNVQIGKYSWLGIGSTIINNLEIADSVVIGGGACVISRIAKSGLFVGVPARRLR